MGAPVTEPAHATTAIPPRTPPLVRWTGRLFVVGSALFLLGVPLGLMAALPAVVSALTFAVGAVFFTTAAALQLVLARREHPQSVRQLIHLWRPQTSDGSAATVQLVGTLLFNVNTIRAVALLEVTPTVLDRKVWAPDALGSVLFGLSAIGAYTVIRTGEQVSPALANGGTAAGAACFLVAAALFGWPRAAA